MKRARIGAIVSSVIVVLSVARCADSDRATGFDQGDPLVAQLVTLGFRRDMIVDRGDYFLVEGDIRISKDAVGRLALSPPRSTLDILRAQPAQELRPYPQWRTDSLVGQTQVQNILVDLSGLASQPAWQNAAREALVKWNTVNCSGVHLAEGTPADIVLLLRATFAGDPFPCAEVKIPVASHFFVRNFRGEGLGIMG